MAILLPLPLGRTGVTATYHQITYLSASYGPDGVFTKGTISIANFLDANKDDPIGADALNTDIAPLPGQEHLEWAYAAITAPADGETPAAKYFGGQPAPDKVTPPSKP